MSPPSLSTMLDSEADFNQRVAEIGFDDAAHQKLIQLGFKTFGRVAFATNFVPGQTAGLGYSCL